MKINLGCGDRYANGWHNVDHAGSPHRKDATIDLTGPLPWPVGSLQLVYAGHLLEHLSLDECRFLLDRLRPCVAVDGGLMVVGPDLDRARTLAAAGVLDVSLESLQCGAHRWPGDEHQWECTPGVIVDLLTATGWQGIVEVPIGEVPAVWPVADRRPIWQCAVTARP